MATERASAIGESTTLAERKLRAGQRLVVGLSGPALTDDERALFRQIRPAGYILFGRNVIAPHQVAELNAELASLGDASRPALLSVDQEGGRVQRIRDGATRWPSARELGAAPHHTAAMATALSEELRAMGFNLDFAPVADVDSNPANPVIGDRAYAVRPEDVANQMRAFIPAMQAAGIIACAKHFPGHGDTSVDSHLDLPRVEKELSDLMRCELLPFEAAVRAGVGSVMTAHVIFPALDESLPATLSPRIVPELLRKRLGFDGVIFSDDLEMKAVHGRWSTEETVTLATRATVDLLLCCKDPGLQLEAFEAMVRGQEREKDLHQAHITSEARLKTLRERFLRGRTPPKPLSVVGCDAHRVLAETIRSQA